MMVSNRTIAPKAIHGHEFTATGSTRAVVADKALLAPNARQGTVLSDAPSVHSATCSSLQRISRNLRALTPPVCASSNTGRVVRQAVSASVQSRTRAHTPPTYEQGSSRPARQPHPGCAAAAGARTTLSAPETHAHAARHGVV